METNQSLKKNSQLNGHISHCAGAPFSDACLVYSFFLSQYQVYIWKSIATLSILPDKNFGNKYNIDKYFKNSKKLDGLIRKHSDFVKVKSGSAISWSSDVLHGATKSLNENKTRISFNFRLISKKHLYLSKPETIRFIEEFNKNIDEFNFLNLLNIGDYKFCMRAIKKNSKLKKFQSYFNSLNFKNSNSFQKSNSFLRYQDEYQFIKTN